MGNVVEVDAQGVLLFVSRLSSSVSVLVLNIHIFIIFGSRVVVVVDDLVMFVRVCFLVIL